MKDHVALVTGAGAGIGEASAKALAAEGATVVIADLKAEDGEAVAHSIEQAGGRAAFFRCDATKPDEVEALVGEIVRRFGRLDAAHNNVGAGRPGATITTLTVEEWDWTLDVSLKSAWLAMKHEIPAMLANGGGAIVNTASMAGVRPTPVSSPAYSAAKAGVIHLTRVASDSYAGQGVRVNSVSPGLVSTPIVKGMLSDDEQAAIARDLQLIGRAVKPEEIADAVVYLLSGRSAMITGINVEVCGGSR